MRKLILLSLLFSSLSMSAVEVFPTPDSASIPYRIPALTRLNTGELLAVADYRPGRTDIGYGVVELHGAISADDGKSWSKPFMVASSKETGGYGDPVLFAHPQNDSIVLISCSGDVGFFDSRRDKHQGISVFYSTDKGKTWSKPFDIGEQIYSLFDDKDFGPVRGLFFTSGQFNYAPETGTLYVAAPMADKNGRIPNVVLYSKDFGRNWNLVGEDPIACYGDECKTCMLPDGNLLFSSRVDGGRVFNVYDYQTGRWECPVFSGAYNSGTVGKTNACNGDILVLPYGRDYIALQSLPLGPGRNNLGVYYKIFHNREDYMNTAKLAADWKLLKQLSTHPCAYSTMIPLKNGNVGVMYEEDLHNTVRGGGYSIVFEELEMPSKD